MRAGCHRPIVWFGPACETHCDCYSVRAVYVRGDPPSRVASSAVQRPHRSSRSATRRRITSRRSCSTGRELLGRDPQGVTNSADTLNAGRDALGLNDVLVFGYGPGERHDASFAVTTTVTSLAHSGLNCTSTAPLSRGPRRAISPSFLTSGFAWSQERRCSERGHQDRPFSSGHDGHQVKPKCTSLAVEASEDPTVETGGPPT